MLEKEFHREMLSIYEKAKDACDFKPIRFLQMVNDHGGLNTAKRLLARDEVQSGLTTLWECGHLDLSMEALVSQPRFRSLFTQEELNTAKQRLIAYGYDGFDLGEGSQ